MKTIHIICYCMLLVAFAVAGSDNQQAGDSRSIEELSALADKGDADAMNSLGINYMKGLGVQKNLNKATEWFHKAADKNNVYAMHSLGLIYSSMNQPAKAVKWYEKAANLGHPPSMNNLANRYKNGDGVPRNIKKAEEWTRKAAEKGNAIAMTNLGTDYAFGNGNLARDDKKAAEWYRKAMEKGYPDAMLRLGVLYMEGAGVDADYPEAYALFSLAGDLGHENGVLAKQRATSMMTAQQIENGKRRAKELDEKYLFSQKGELGWALDQ